MRETIGDHHATINGLNAEIVKLSKVIGRLLRERGNDVAEIPTDDEILSAVGSPEQQAASELDKLSEECADPSVVKVHSEAKAKILEGLQMKLLAPFFLLIWRAFTVRHPALGLTQTKYMPLYVAEFQFR